MSEIGIQNNVAMTTPGDDTSQEVLVATAEANVFFDGTDNNYFNTMSPVKPKGQESYTNGLTNVARIWSSMQRDKKLNAVYIDGIGTTRGKDDSTRGYALGLGETGVEARALQAFPELMEKVRLNRGTKGLPKLLHVNVYGFSRGSAAARHFVHLVNEDRKIQKPAQRKYLKGDRWKDVKVNINFVGLFDTVSSVGYSHTSSDVESLHLNFEADYAAKVFHLTALDEYREHFASTTIASAVGLPHMAGNGERMGYELAIPGAHSDVGGSYHDMDDEYRSLDPAQAKFVLDQGLYTAQDGAPSNRGRAAYHRKVSGALQKVPLALMVDKANENIVGKLPNELIEATTGDADLDSMCTTLRGIAKEEKKAVWRLEEQFDAAKVKALRRQFIHLSFHDDTGYAPRMLNGVPARQQFEG